MELIRAIAQRVHKAGGRALLVGGCVRDALLGVPSGDIDCEVHGVAPDALRALLASFGSIDASGEAYGIYTLKGRNIDIALPRREARTGKTHRDFVVSVDPQLPPAQAAARRDFTVNAIMQDALTGEIVDPYGGAEDLKFGVLRAVPGGQFEEDPLRVVRGAQFAARFHLSPDEETIRIMRRMPLDHLSAARVQAEMKKALMQADKPSVFFEVLRSTGALLPWFEELAALCGVEQNPQYHPEGDAWTHTMMTLNEAAQIRDQQAQPYAFMLAALTHDLGKAVSMQISEEGVRRAIGHERTGQPIIGSLLARLGVSKSEIAYAQNMCALHMRVHACYYEKARASRTNVLFDESVSPRELAWLVVCDSRGTGKPRASADEEKRFVMERLAAYKKAASQTMPDAGMMMAAGVAPGPQMGRALKDARRLRIEGKELSEAVRLVAGRAK